MNKLRKRLLEKSKTDFCKVPRSKGKYCRMIAYDIGLINRNGRVYTKNSFDQMMLAGSLFIKDGEHPTSAISIDAKPNLRLSGFKGEHAVIEELENHALEVVNNI